MSRQTKPTEQLRDTAVIAEEAGYEGEVSWEAFKKALNEERPPHSKPFPES
ncbi:MAG: hypothetical protein ACRDSJ_07910 [Rubrobacteraceae bacterium]